MTYVFKKVSVLIVEDNQPMMDIVRSLLLTFGIGEVLCAKNGEEGFALYKKHKPDLVIADWMMRPMDGISLTQKIRTSSDTPNPFCPVILMTGFSEKQRVLEARDSGVTEFLVKPFHVKDLYKRLAQIIERPRRFVDSKYFFGPDRRRKSCNTYEGPKRREDDKLVDIIPERIKYKKRKAHEVFRKQKAKQILTERDQFGWCSITT